AFDCDIIAVDHWLELPEPYGRCPWSADEMISSVSRAGLGQFAFVRHRGESTILQWADATALPGDSGTMVFVHDRVLPEALPVVLRNASVLGQRLADLADLRLDQLVKLAYVRDLKADVIEQLEKERDVQAVAAAERLAVIETLTTELARR